MRFKNLISGLSLGVAALLTPAAQAAYSDVVLADSPYRYWTFDEAGAANAVEQVTTNGSYALALNGSTREAHGVTGSGLLLGNALKYNGGNPYNPFYNASLGQIGTNITGSYVIELWFKSDRTDQGQRALFRIGDDPNFHPGVIYDAADQSVHLIHGPSASLVSSGRATVPGSATGWHHLVIGVFQDGSSDVTAISARIDGVATTLSVGSFNSDLDFGSGWTDNQFGAATPSSLGGNQFFGSVDELALYDATGLDTTQFEAKLDALALHYQAALPTFQITGQGALGAFAVGSVDTAEVAVVNNSATTIALTSVGFSGANAGMLVVDSAPTALAPYAAGVIVVEVTAGLSVGNYAATLDIATDNVGTPTAALGLTFRVTEPYSALILNKDPYLYWNFDEVGAAVNAVEQVRGESNASLQIAAGARRTYVEQGDPERTMGAAYQFAGGNPYSGFYNGSLNPVGSTITGSYAIEFWFKSTSTTQGDRGILKLGNDTNLHPAIIYDAADHSLRLLNGNATSPSSSGRAVIPTHPLGWHHVVIGVFQDGTSTVTGLTAVIDGIEVPIALGTFNSDLDFGTGWDNDFFGGRTPDNISGGNQFFGLIDELAIYNLSGLTEPDFDAKLTALGGHFSSPLVPTELSTISID